MSSCSKVARSASRLRDAVNALDDPPSRFGKGWKRLCAAMDIAEDSSQAICAAIDQLDRMKSISLGNQYLTIYGMLQAMILQHDAVEVIDNLVNKHSQLRKTEVSKSLHRIRKIIAGHPLNVRHPGPPSVWGIIRGTVDKPAQLEVYNWGANDHTFVTEPVNLFMLSDDHSQQVRSVLIRSCRVLRRGL